MAKFLRDLLEAEEPLFSLSITQLEKASGHHGTDTKLIGEIMEKAHASMRDLGLDPADTTGREFYNALVNRIVEDNKRISRLIGADHGHYDDVRHMVTRIVRAAKSVDTPMSCWVLKRSVAKDLLRQMPPKKLMEHLGYRSIDSMLKHEPLDEIYTALRFSEGGEWLNEYNELFKQVTPSDFESRPINIIIMDHDKYVDLATHFVEKKRHNITHTKEMGTIVVVPMHAEKMRGIALKSLPLIFHYINEIRLYSAFFKLKQVRKNFGEVVVETLIADPGTASQMAGQHVHWRVIQRYFGKLEGESHPEAFEPHVHPEDLHWRKAEELLYQLDPDMAFWKDKDYVGMIQDGRPVTLNLMDVSLGYSNGETYEERYVYHFRESLWNEIFIRYMGHKNLEDQVLSQLDNDMIAPERLSAPKDKRAEKEAGKVRSNIRMRQKLIDAAEGRLIGVSQEFVKAFTILEKYEKTVSIFGSARMPQDSESYNDAYQVALALSTKGYTVVTGGGYGIMEAANRGAYETGGNSIGFNINLPTEQKLNQYTTESYEFEHFFGRKVALSLETSAYIYFPGGFGTMDELFEVLTLVQTGKVPRVPVILYGKDFWLPLFHVIETTFDKKYHTINPEDTHLFQVVDSPDEVVEIVLSREGDRHKQPEGAMPHSREQHKD